MSAAIKLNECRGDASSGNFPSPVRAANSNDGGGGMDDILNRLGTVESAVSEIRQQVIGIVATIPSFATKSDVDAVRIEVSELRGEVRGIAAIIPHLATKADLSAEIGSVRADLKTEIGSVRAAISALETSIIKWLIATGSGRRHRKVRPLINEHIDEYLVALRVITASGNSPGSHEGRHSRL
jgi:hypothetical protein